MNQYKSFTEFLNEKHTIQIDESAFHAALAKAKEEGLEEFEFAGKTFKVKKDALEEGAINEGLAQYEPESLKAIQKALDPLFKKLNVEVKEIFMDNSKWPFVSIKTYNVITGGSWTAARFFNKKDADACVKLFETTEVKVAAQRNGSEYGAKVDTDSFGTYLYWSDITGLNDKLRLGVDIKTIDAICEELKNNK